MISRLFGFVVGSIVKVIQLLVVLALLALISFYGTSAFFFVRYMILYEP